MSSLSLLPDIAEHQLPKASTHFAARLAKKAEVRAIFLLASEETSLHNIEDLIDTAEYSLSLLRKGEILKYIQ
ncbi:hypothetical protein RGQ29_019965 [Quercus rubra]|uniref:LYR motif containing domain-containing protein n=1 Tax=Quercus rubra TaxID=3512 RepID=A0AAN7IWH4_QUERU|nr:hypothetical protein RGQ29_019965 [Quercus rubra]KAK4589181.1 hypothetical protein RGQ29_019965 [Quercus rubra]KAK4589182.1 hypothetical protein RGQ29_019965 [Quercus rubra]KAK4589183.1 hypothetical protein RGQ29_019965 [Quercus rubra]KAK4589184.1 hypothetical protein RGQ29_019965 [Quercus rubra]